MNLILYLNSDTCMSNAYTNTSNSDMSEREDSLMGWSLTDRFGDRSMTHSSAPPRADSDLKSTCCFCAHMHEMMKYFLFTENQ